MNKILFVVIVSLFILTTVFFSLDRPYWYVSILTLTLVISLILLKIMWGVSGWATDKVHEFTDKEKY